MELRIIQKLKPFLLLVKIGTKCLKLKFQNKNIKMYQMLARINKMVLPSFTKQRLDLAQANKWQMAIIGWRYFVTKKALGN